MCHTLAGKQRTEYLHTLNHARQWTLLWHTNPPQKVTGTGTDATPATMGFEGPIGYQDVEAARNS